MLVIASAPRVTALPQSPQVIQFWYTWGTSKIGGAQVRTFGGTNLTMNATIYEQNGTPVGAITEFRVFASVPGGEAYPPGNGTNPFPHPMISAIYDTIQVVRTPGDCVWINNSVGFVCEVIRTDWRHQVLEMRFLRLIEFDDVDGDGGYETGEPVRSQLDLGDPGIRYAIPDVKGSNDSMAAVDLAARNHSPDVCCGEAWDGWIGQNENAFASFEGLRFRLSGAGLVNLTIIGYQWFEPRSFQGTNVTPLQVKLGLRIADYPFVAASSRLALEVNLTSFRQGSATNWEVIPWAQGQGWGMDAGETTALFAWSATALADGAPVPVVGTTVPRDAFSRHVLLAYPRASAIEHDPVFGITDKRLVSGTIVRPVSLTPWIPIAAILGTSAVVLYTVMRRRR